MINTKRNGVVVRNSDGGNDMGRSVLNGNTSRNNRTTTTTKISTSGGGESRSSTAVSHGDGRNLKSTLDSTDLSSDEENTGKQNSQKRDPIASSSSSPHRCDYIVGKNSGVITLETNNSSTLVCKSDSPPCYTRSNSDESFSMPPIGPSIPKQRSSIYASTKIETSSSTFQCLQPVGALGSSTLSEVNFDRGSAWKLQSPDGTLIKVTPEERGWGDEELYMYTYACVFALLRSSIL